jgi:hypothetical protein
MKSEAIKSSEINQFSMFFLVFGLCFVGLISLNSCYTMNGLKANGNKGMNDRNISNYDVIIFKDAILNDLFASKNYLAIAVLNNKEVAYQQLVSNAVYTHISGDTVPKDKMSKRPNRPALKKNIGFFERIVRFIIAILLTSYFMAGIEVGVLSLSILVLVLALLPTSLFGFCPFYYFFDITTIKKLNRSNS